MNSFGIGGANAHVVLDSAVSFGIGRNHTPVASKPHLLIFSANHPDSLRRHVENIDQYVRSNQHAVLNVAHTLGTRRERLVHQAFAVTDGTLPLECSKVAKAKTCPELTFVFTGQGSQWVGMGRELMTDFSVFREAIIVLDRVLARLPDSLSWTIESELLMIRFRGLSLLTIG